MPHPVHIHLARFQIARRDGGDPGPYDAGWKDTVNLDSGGQADILIKFDGFRGGTSSTATTWSTRTWP